MRLQPLFVLLFVVLFGAVSSINKLTAQTTTSGGLTGVVTDPSNAVVPNVDVEIEDNAKGTTQAMKTDREGVYRFFFLAPGRFTLTVTHSGFREEIRTVNVPLGPPVSVNITLAIAKATTALTVTSEAALIQTENGDVATTMNQKQISEVPNPGNDLTYIVQTAPGVVMNTDAQFGGGSQFSILGMPSNSYLYTMDGMNFDGGSSGALGLLLGQNQIQEATVVSTGYSGQYGSAAGGSVNYFTKSGSNALHGNAQYYWNGRVFNANDWFLNALGHPRPFDIANQWAGSLGGPIKKDKLFFFFDTEGLRLLLPQLSFVTIPSPQFEAATLANIDSIFGAMSASDAFYKQIFSLYTATPGASAATSGGFSPTDPTGCTGFTRLGKSVPCALHFVTPLGHPSQDSLTSGRMDWNIGKYDRVFSRIQNDHGHVSFPDPISSLFEPVYKVSWWQGQLVETHTFASSGASQFLMAGTYIANIAKVGNSSQALSAFPTTLSFVPGTFTNLGGVDNFQVFGHGRYETQYQLSEDVVKIWGKQKLGFGANFVWFYWNDLPNRDNTIGQLTAQTLDAFYQGGVDPASPASDYTGLTQAFMSQTGHRHISSFNLGLYGQDEWHARPNLTLTLALRAEHYSNPVCPNRCFGRLAGPFDSISHDPNQPYNQAILPNQKQALENIDSILWSPRLSFAWQPLGVSRNSVLRGGLGLFYDPLPGQLLDPFSGNAPIYNSYFAFGDNLTPNEKTSLFRDTAASNAAFLKGFVAGQTLAQIQSAIPNFFPPAISVAERTTHFPQYQRWSLEWQQALSAATSVNVGYYGHHGIHELVQNADANGYGFGSLPAGLCTSPPVPPCSDPRFGVVTEYLSKAISNYNGMIISFRHRFSEGLLEANYTYSHAFDEISNGGLNDFTSVGLILYEANNLRSAYGPAEYDARHSLNASYVWEPPVKTALRGHGPDSLVKGWQVSGTIFARTGFPYTVIDYPGNFANKNSFGGIYSVPAGPLGSGRSCGEGAAIPLAPHPCQPPQVLADGSPNPNASFLQAGCETGFNTGHLPGPSGPCSGPLVTFFQKKNRFRGPSYFNTDFALIKNTKLRGWEKGVLGIGFQFFNLFNHPNFGSPQILSSDPNFGQISYLEQSPTSILGSAIGGDAAPRMIQVKAQLQF